MLSDILYIATFKNATWSCIWFCVKGKCDSVVL